VHFENRDDFLLAVINEVLAEFIDSIISTGTKGEDLEKTIDLFTRIAETGATLSTGEPERVVNVRVLLEAGSRIPEIDRRFAALIQDAVARLAMAVGDAQRADAARNDIDAESGASILVAAAIGFIVMVETKVNIDLAGVRETALKLLMNEKP
jgi:AcrR family transcriptional regulator